MSLRALAAVARAPFLLLPVTLVAVGAAAGACDGAFSWLRTVVALVGLVGLHAAVNALNEASDFRTGIDLETRRTPFSGGSGTLPAGELSPAAAVALAVVGATIGFAAGVWFMFLVGPPLLPILLLGGIATLVYTEFLARHYVGELFAGLGLGLLPVVGTALVQAGSVGPTAVVVGVPAFFMTFNLLLLNEFPDEVADRVGGRHNLVLLLGRRGAALRGLCPGGAGRHPRRRVDGGPPAAGPGRSAAIAAPRRSAPLGATEPGRRDSGAGPGRQRRLDPADQHRAGGRPGRGLQSGRLAKRNPRRRSCVIL